MSKPTHLALTILILFALAAADAVINRLIGFKPPDGWKFLLYGQPSFWAGVTIAQRHNFK
jgi:hypothetical protein